MLFWFMAFGSGLANIIVGWAAKGAQNAGCRVVRFGGIGVLCALPLILAVLPFFPGACMIPGVWGIGAVLGALLSAALTLNVIAYRMGPPSVAWGVANMGILVPVFGSCWLGESLDWYDLLLLATFGLMVGTFSRGVSRAGDPIRVPLLRYGLLLLAQFAANGLLMFCFKLNGYYWPEANKLLLLAVMYGACAVIFVTFMTIMIIRAKRRHIPEKNAKAERGTWKWGALMGVALAVTQILLQLSISLPAAVVFPLVQGTSLMGGVLFMATVYRERLNPEKVAGLFLGVAVILLSVL